nr:alanine racemase [Maliibacterium massiliense]
MRPTWVDVDLDAIRFNVKEIKKNLPPDTRLMAVIKADAYGHGMLPVARAVLSAGASFLGLATVDEALQLRAEGIDAPLLILGAPVRQNMQALIAQGVSQTIWLPQQLLALAEAAQRVGRPALVHLKVDTGMNRIGVQSDAQLAALLDILAQDARLHLEGVFTHFATADDADARYMQMQHARFDRAVACVRARGFAPIVHAANSAASLHVASAHYDMVRPGYAIYGYDPGPAGGTLPLKKALSWKSRVVNLKWIEAGESVSYGIIFTARRRTRVATVPVGYADGYRRCIGNRGYALVRESRAPVIGRVCMDQMMLDVTDIAGVALEDEVVLLGGQGAESIDADLMASWQDTIGYEVLCAIGKRVPRMYTGDVQDAT